MKVEFKEDYRADIELKAGSTGEIVHRDGDEVLVDIDGLETAVWTSTDILTEPYCEECGYRGWRISSNKGGTYGKVRPCVHCHRIEGHEEAAEVAIRAVSEIKGWESVHLMHTLASWARELLEECGLEIREGMTLPDAEIWARQIEAASGKSLELLEWVNEFDDFHALTEWDVNEMFHRAEWTCQLPRDLYNEIPHPDMSRVMEVFCELMPAEIDDGDAYPLDWMNTVIERFGAPPHPDEFAAVGGWAQAMAKWLIRAEVDCDLLREKAESRGLTPPPDIDMCDSPEAWGDEMIDWLDDQGLTTVEDNLREICQDGPGHGTVSWLADIAAQDASRKRREAELKTMTALYSREDGRREMFSKGRTVSVLQTDGQLAIVELGQYIGITRRNNLEL